MRSDCPSTTRRRFLTGSATLSAGIAATVSGDAFAATAELPSGGRGDLRVAFRSMRSA